MIMRILMSCLAPVLLPAMFVSGVKGTYGTLMDNCSTDNYFVNDIARKQKLRCVREVHLEVEGMCVEVTRVESKVAGQGRQKQGSCS